MAELWFVLLSFMLVMFVVLDGWNIGAGILHLIVARTEAERRQVIFALGPLWSWHEVWLVAAGGTFLLAFPAVMAASFAGFYLALWLVLWTLVLRGISIEVGGHIDDPMWQSAWDFVFAMASLLLAVLFGAALGNVIRGVPLGANGRFAMSLFTDFGVRGTVGILDWYTLSIAIFAAIALAAHGATYLRLETHGRVRERCERWMRRLWAAVVATFPVVSAETWIVRPDLAASVMQRPFGWIAIVAVIAGAGGVWTGIRNGRERRALAGSSGILAGLLGGAAAGAFPVILHSTLAPEHSLTVYNGAASGRGLSVALVWWPVAALLAFTYAAVIVRRYAASS